MVLNPTELVKAGLMEPGLGRRLQEELGALPVSQGVQGDVEVGPPCAVHKFCVLCIGSGCCA